MIVFAFRTSPPDGKGACSVPRPCSFVELRNHSDPRDQSRNVKQKRDDPSYRWIGARLPLRHARALRRRHAAHIDRILRTLADSRIHHPPARYPYSMWPLMKERATCCWTRSVHQLISRSVAVATVNGLFGSSRLLAERHVLPNQFSLGTGLNNTRSARRALAFTGCGINSTSKRC